MNFQYQQICFKQCKYYQKKNTVHSYLMNHAHSYVQDGIQLGCICNTPICHTFVESMLCMCKYDSRYGTPTHTSNTHQHVLQHTHTPHTRRMHVRYICDSRVSLDESVGLEYYFYHSICVILGKHLHYVVVSLMKEVCHCLYVLLLVKCSG